ncbi:MAG TPA: hypothetical protein VJN65_05970 [Bacteroidota bacterium]|nr:hypothetical protein [Bacteroidota bacterium]
MINRVFLTFFIVVCCASCYDIALCQSDLRIWNEFIGALKSGKMSVDRIRPHKQLGDEYKPILLGYLDSVRTQAAPEDWTVEPEVIRIDDRIQYIIPWSTRGQKISYCFSFVTEDSQWYFQHLEAVFIRLDKVHSLPASDFPDISDQQKNWAREEIYWSFVVMNFYLPVAKEKGKEFALGLLKDGGGYFVGAKTWVPFAAPQKAFILYLCWEQEKLRGNDVMLIKLEEKEAIVELTTHFFALYFTAAHLKPRISLDDYKQIFETIWRDRASNAGWILDIQYTREYKVIFHFRR